MRNRGCQKWHKPPDTLYVHHSASAISANGLSQNPRLAPSWPVDVLGLTESVDALRARGHAVDLERGDAGGAEPGRHLRPDVVVVVLVAGQLLVGDGRHESVLRVGRHRALFICRPQRS